MVYNVYIKRSDIMDKIIFKKLDGSVLQYKKIYEWCSMPFVYKYFEQRKLSYDEIVNKYKKRLRKNAHTKTFIINYNDFDIGIIQYSKVLMDDIRRFKLYEYGECYQLDIFIGDKNYLNKGIGTQVLCKMIRWLEEEYGYNCFVAFIESENIGSIKCFNKLGFVLYKEFRQNDSLGVKSDYSLVIKK